MSSIPGSSCHGTHQPVTKSESDPTHSSSAERHKMTKQEADDHRRLLEEKLLGIRTDKSCFVASMSAMAVVMAGAEGEPLDELVVEKQIMSRTMSLPSNPTSTT